MDDVRHPQVSRSGWIGWVLPLLLTTVSAVAAETTLDEARALHIEGRLDEALKAYDEVAVASEKSDPASAASARNNACLIYVNRGEHRTAVEACREALRLRRQVDDPRRLARTLNNLGLALQYVGDYEEASLHFREALSINESIDDVESQVINHSNLGVVAMQLGRYSAALDSHGLARTLAEDHPDAPWSAAQTRVAQINQAVVLERLGEYREALDIYLQVLVDREAMDPSRRANLIANVGVVYRNLGDPVRAVEMFEEAEETFQRLGDRAARANAILNLALTLDLNLERPAEAEAAYRRALAMARESGDRAEEVQALYHLGRLLLREQRAEQASEAFEDARAASEESGSSEVLWQAEDGLGRVSAARGDLEGALRRFESAMDTIEAMRDELGRESLRSRWFGERRSVYAAAVATLARLEGEHPGAGYAARGLETVQRAKARSLLESLGAPAGQAEPLEAEEIANRVGRGLLVEFFVGEEALFAWTVHDGAIRMADLGRAGPMLEAVSSVHAALAAGREPSRAELESLTNDLLLDSGVAAPFDELWIAPDGRLWYLPFELLAMPGHPSDRVIEWATVSYFPSASTIASRGSKDLGDRLSAASIGAPRLDVPEAGYPTAARLLAARFALGEIPGASAELEMVAETMPEPVALYEGEAGTEEAFAEVMRRGARVLHVASHTVVDERPGAGAAILLSPTPETDGLLHPSEISRLDAKVDLVVLSACRSALGSEMGSDAMMSLTGAFLAAGSSAIIATLWDVDDEATRVFMEQFYRRLANGIEPAVALQRTKRQFIEDPRWSASSLWAAYVMVGRAEPVASAGIGARPWLLVVALGFGFAAVVLAVRVLRSARVRRS